MLTQQRSPAISRKYSSKSLPKTLAGEIFGLYCNINKRRPSSNFCPKIQMIDVDLHPKLLKGAPLTAHMFRTVCGRSLQQSQSASKESSDAGSWALEHNASEEKFLPQASIMYLVRQEYHFWLLLSHWKILFLKPTVSLGCWGFCVFHRFMWFKVYWAEKGLVLVCECSWKHLIWAEHTLQKVVCVYLSNWNVLNILRVYKTAFAVYIDD